MAVSCTESQELCHDGAAPALSAVSGALNQSLRDGFFGQTERQLATVFKDLSSCLVAPVVTGIVVDLVDGLEHDWLMFPFSWEFHTPNCRTYIFQRGRYTTNQLIFGESGHPQG